MKRETAAIHRTGRRSIFVVLAMILAAVCGPELPAADPVDNFEMPDRVTLQANEGSGKITLPCRIIDYTGKSISVRTRAGTAVRDYDARLVLDVQTPQTPSHIEGIEKFRKSEFAEARRSFESALDAENRTWVRRELLALLVRCSLRLGDPTTAGGHFLALAKSDPETRHFGLAPLEWAIEPVSKERISAARNWKAQRTEAARLLAASVLLTDKESAQDASIELRALATSTSESISALANAQLWRKRLMEGDVTREEVDRWHARILATPERLRAGGFFVAGQVYRLRKEHDRAAAALLWPPLAYPDDASLAAVAQVDAALSLMEIGQRAEGRRLLKEVVDRYPDSKASLRATKALQQSRNDDP